MSAPPAAAWSDLDAGSTNDRAWFARHIGRNHRIRKPIGSEHLFVEHRHGFKPMIVVKQIEPGMRLRMAVCWRRGEPLLNGEAWGERLFASAIEGAHVPIVERGQA